MKNQNARNKMKKQSKRKAGDMILVKWLDQSYYTGPIEANSDASQKAIGETLGFFIHECSDWLSMAMEKFTTDRICYRHIVTFPKVAIIKVREVLPRGV
jgi:hypothetical protein